MSRFAMACALALCFFASPAAALEGEHVEISPYAGVAMWDADSGLEDDMLFGARLGIFPLPWIGVEGTWGISPTETNFTPDDDVQMQHVGANLVLNLLPGRRFVPYLSGGWSEVYAKPSATDERSDFNGWEFGGGVKWVLGETDHTNYALRLDARDVLVKFDPAAPASNDVTHNVLVTAGLSMGLGGKAADTDGDGVSDRIDECPDTPAGAIVSARGCPLDSDGDGVYDGLDQCDGPEGARVDSRGCPTDSDGDGVYDGLDQCDRTPKGAKIDAKGCPMDADGDGVADGIDTCPNTPKGATVDAKGCPNDSDDDGVVDGIDACPGTPANTEVDARGCPVPQSEKEVELLDTGSLQMDNIYFESAKATIKTESHAALNEVADILARWPQLRIEVGGHTDSQGAAAFNQDLSERRAQAVLDYLVRRAPNIQVGQFSVKGYGENEPVASNDTSEGRARNRRVVFKVLNPGVLKK